MTMSDTEASDQHETGWTVATGRTITAERVLSIPKRVVEERGISPGDLVDVRIYGEYSPTTPPVIEIHEALVRTRHRVTIPEHRLAVHALDCGRGSSVDIEIRPTGLHYATYADQFDDEDDEQDEA